MENRKYFDQSRGLILSLQEDNVAEWLRRQTRNLLGSTRAGSNPAVVEFFKPFFFHFMNAHKAGICM